MARYTSTVELSFGTYRHSRIVNAEVSDVTINQWNGIEYVPTGTVISADTSESVVTRGLKLQFVVQAGGAVNIEEGKNE